MSELTLSLASLPEALPSTPATGNRLMRACFAATLINSPLSSSSAAFVPELPRFVAAVRQIFSTDDIAAYFEAIEEDAGYTQQAWQALAL